MTDSVTVKEAATEAGITRNAVWLAIKRGRLQAKKRGRDWHIDRSEWDRYRREVGRSGKIDAPIDTRKEDKTGSDEPDGAHQEAI